MEVKNNQKNNRQKLNENQIISTII